MAQNIHDDDQDNVEFTVTNLRPPRSRASIWQRLHLDVRRWRWVAVAISLTLALTVVFNSVSATHTAFGRLAGLAFPTATPVIRIVSSVHASQIIITEDTVPTPIPTVSTIPHLGRAPTSCPQQPAKLQAVGPGPGKAIGGPSVWLDGFTGTYPTLSLRNVGQESNHPFGWPLRYTQYGWTVPITLIRAPTVKTPIIVSGIDLQNRQPIWFAFAAAAAHGAPVNISTNLTLDPQNPAVPASGNDTTRTDWNGYIFLPHAGCYQLYIDVPATFNIWQAMISAGL